MDRNRYEEKVEARRERLEAQADRLQSEGAARFKRGDAALQLIPFGQPILIGHHSEHRDRNYRNRAWENMHAGHGMMKQADDVARRAEAVGTGGVSSDDPDAPDKLSAKLAKLEEQQAMMAAVNKLVRKFKAKPEEGAKAIVAAYPGIFTEATAAEVFKPDFAGRVGFAAYQLSNNNANIRRIRDRIEALKANADRATKEREINGVRLVENAEENRIQLFFQDKPDEATRSELKSAGFRWAPSEGAWQRQLNNRAVWVAETLIARLATA